MEDKLIFKSCLNESIWSQGKNKKYSDKQHSSEKTKFVAKSQKNWQLFAAQLSIAGHNRFAVN